MLLTNSTKRIDMTECVFVLSASYFRLHLLPRLNSSYDFIFAVPAADPLVFR